MSIPLECIYHTQRTKMGSDTDTALANIRSACADIIATLSAVCEQCEAQIVNAMLYVDGADDTDGADGADGADGVVSYSLPSLSVDKLDDALVGAAPISILSKRKQDKLTSLVCEAVAFTSAEDQRSVRQKIQRDVQKSLRVARALHKSEQANARKLEQQRKLALGPTGRMLEEQLFAVHRLDAEHNAWINSNGWSLTNSQRSITTQELNNDIALAESQFNTD